MHMQIAVERAGDMPGELGLAGARRPGEGPSALTTAPQGGDQGVTKIGPSLNPVEPMGHLPVGPLRSGLCTG